MSSKAPKTTNPTARALIQRLESLQLAGITHLRGTTASASDQAAVSPAESISPECDVSSDTGEEARNAESTEYGNLPSATDTTDGGDMSKAVRKVELLSPRLSTNLSAVRRPANSAETAVFAAESGPLATSESIGAASEAAAPIASLPPDDPRCVALAAVAKKVAACKRCQELAKSRTQTVFGVGNPYARLVFCGEAPGADEDRQGEPFVGRAGKLLTDIIEKGMKKRREDVYILNILRCRPPDNRNPLPAEAAACREFLDRQLAIIQPEFICCLGAVAAQNLLGTDVAIGRLRGRFHDYQGIRVICTYHPAYVLRNPQAKKPVWDDVQMLMAEMERSGGVS